MLLAIILAAASPATTQTSGASSGPYKLVISWHQSDLTIIDYPNKARCEQAKQAIDNELARKDAEFRETLPAGSITIGKSPNGAFCIPG